MRGERVFLYQYSRVHWREHTTLCRYFRTEHDLGQRLLELIKLDVMVFLLDHNSFVLRVDNLVPETLRLLSHHTSLSGHERATSHGRMSRHILRFTFVLPTKAYICRAPRLLTNMDVQLNKVV